MTARSPYPAPGQGFPPVTLSGVPFCLTRLVPAVMLSVKTLFEHAPSIPIYVISGFLGSGKTTFLQGLLAYAASQGLQPAILINDYGDVSTDSERLRGQGYPAKTFADGCICCTLRPDLNSALTDLISQQPDVIFIEATGPGRSRPLVGSTHPYRDAVTSVCCRDDCRHRRARLIPTDGRLWSAFVC